MVIVDLDPAVVPLLGALRWRTRAGAALLKKLLRCFFNVVCNFLAAYSHLCPCLSSKFIINVGARAGVPMEC